MVAILDECGYSSIELVLAAVEGLLWLHVVASLCLANEEDLLHHCHLTFLICNIPVIHCDSSFVFFFTNFAVLPCSLCIFLGLLSSTELFCIPLCSSIYLTGHSLAHTQGISNLLYGVFKNLQT